MLRFQNFYNLIPGTIKGQTKLFIVLCEDYSLRLMNDTFSLTSNFSKLC